MPLTEELLRQRFDAVKANVDEQRRKRVAPSDDSTVKLRMQIQQLNRDLTDFMRENNLQQLPVWAKDAMPDMLDYARKLFKLKNPANEVDESYQQAKKLYLDLQQASDVEKKAKREIVLTALRDAETGYRNLQNDNPHASQRGLTRIPDDLAEMIRHVENWPSRNPREQPQQMGQNLRQPVDLELLDIPHEQLDTLFKRINEMNYQFQLLQSQTLHCNN